MQTCAQVDQLAESQREHARDRHSIYLCPPYGCSYGLHARRPALPQERQRAVLPAALSSVVAQQVRPILLPTELHEPVQRVGKQLAAYGAAKVSAAVSTCLGHVAWRS